MAADVVGDADGEVVTVDEGHIVVVLTVTGSEGELGKGGRGDTGTSAGVALETAVAATVSAGVGSGVGAEVAVPASLYPSWLELSHQEKPV